MLELEKEGYERNDLIGISASRPPWSRNSHLYRIQDRQADHRGNNLGKAVRQTDLIEPKWETTDTNH